MTDLELIIANKKYSSWSLRPWLALKVFDIPFTETLSQFDHTPDDPADWNRHFRDFSPTGKVPVLRHGDITVWESLAILDYLSELFPKKCWLPENEKDRAVARSLCAEMHSGFPALRNECPMNMARPVSAIEVTDACKKDIARIEAIWEERLAASGGPFLFGEFKIVDAMYAPLVNRFEKYVLSKTEATTTYTAAMKSLSAWAEWEAAGAAEPWICAIAEV